MSSYCEVIQNPSKKEIIEITHEKHKENVIFSTKGNIFDFMKQKSKKCWIVTTETKLFILKLKLNEVRYICNLKEVRHILLIDIDILLCLIRHNFLFLPEIY